MNAPKLTHLDERGAAHMVDISAKPVQRRRAGATGKLFCAPETLSLLRDGKTPKGDAFAAARIAGILAAKRVDELIPLCHSLPIDAAALEFTLAEDHVFIRSEMCVSAKTGIEMEALCAVSVAALTLYDMLKAADKNMRITDVTLEFKEKM